MREVRGIRKSLMVVKVICGIICVIFVGNFFLCYFMSRNRYEDSMEYVDKEEYGLKDFIPMGLWMSGWQWQQKFFPIQMKSFMAQHRNQVYQKILELKGPRNAAFFHYIHNGYRLAAAMITSAGASIVGLIMAFQGDPANGLILSIVAVVAFFAVPFLVDNSLKSQIEKRRLEIRMEFPEFVNKLTLLVNAGMTISRAWEKIINENKKNHILYSEMQYALMEIKAGKPERIAYEEFARRCRVKEVTKFVSVIVMNLRRGGGEVIPVLREQGNECWEMRKNAARQLGEEAGTKILIPLMIMFLGIVLVVATPAVLGMTSGM